MKKHSHYYKKVPYEYIDVYRVLELFDVTNPCIQHAVKKLLVAGGRGHKNMENDVREAIDSLTRWIDMRNEDAKGINVSNMGMIDVTGPIGSEGTMYFPGGLNGPAETVKI